MTAINQIHQAGGHQDQVTTDSSQPDKIIKKTNKNELEFYQSIVNQLEQLNSPENIWSDWRPQFFGLSSHQPNQLVAITLENLTYKRPTTKSKPGEEEPDQLFNHPTVIDIKLGQRLYDDQATPEKQERMHRAALETTSAKFGMRLTGAQLWNNLNGEYSYISKSFGKSIKPDGSDLKINFNSLFPISDLKSTHEPEHNQLTYSTEGLPSNLIKQIIDLSIIPKIQKILNYLSSFTWRIYGSSLLIVFEADLNTLNTAFNSPNHHQIIEDLASVKVIDFAHVQLADTPDFGLLKGIQSTLDLFHQLSQELTKA